MAFTKTENRVARTGPDDVRISFHVADAGSPDAGQLIAAVHIETGGGPSTTTTSGSSAPARTRMLV